MVYSVTQTDSASVINQILTLTSVVLLTVESSIPSGALTGISSEGTPIQAGTGRHGVSCMHAQTGQSDPEAL